MEKLYTVNVGVIFLIPSQNGLVHKNRHEKSSFFHTNFGQG